MTNEEIDVCFMVHLNASTTGRKQSHPPTVSRKDFLEAPPLKKI